MQSAPSDGRYMSITDAAALSLLRVNGNKTHKVVSIQSLELLRLQVKMIEDFAKKEGVEL